DPGRPPLLRRRPVGQSPRARSRRITSAYGHAATGGVLRRRRAAQLLAGGGAARRDAAGGQPAGAVARAAARPAAARPLWAARPADRSRTPPLPQRAAAPRARGADRRRARRGRGWAASGVARDRRLDRPGRKRPRAPAL